MRDIYLAVNICTYHREAEIKHNIHQLLSSDFFANRSSKYYGKMEIYVIDNGSELQVPEHEGFHLIHNRNTGGSGGFQRGIQEIRSSKENFTHVIFMDDDVRFETKAFYLLFDYLENNHPEDKEPPVAGRMFCMDRPHIQYTAAERWNGGKIQHIEFMRAIDENYEDGRILADPMAEYGGWWFCCFPMGFVRENDIIPFFIHCDDVEYGLRYGRSPVMIEGVHVWHETFEHRISPMILYYDTRNPLFVNELHHLGDDPSLVIREWKDNITKYHIKEDWQTEYYIIRGMYDYLKGISWLYKTDSEAYHKKLQKMKGSRIRNAVLWRLAYRKFLRKFHLKEI